MTLWIIHRQAHHRNLLARLAGAGQGTVLAGPEEDIFESLSAGDRVLLGVSEDFEAELAFVGRQWQRVSEARWLLLAAPGDLAEARRLFDSLPARWLPYPPDSPTLRRTLRDLDRPSRILSLSARRERDALGERFDRWFGNTELPELERAIDPGLESVPILLLGEVGTGRGLIARYIHAFGGHGEGAFVHVSCPGIRGRAELIDAIAGSAEESGDRSLVWLEEVDRLPWALQRELRDWIEFGAPAELLGLRRIRWLAGASDAEDLDADPGLEARLGETLSGLTLRLPTLREAPESIDRVVLETASAWSGARGETPRRFSPEALDVLASHPWLGNHHELEAVVIRTLSVGSNDPLLPADLRFPGDGGLLDALGTSSASFAFDEVESEALAADFGSEDGDLQRVFEGPDTPEPLFGASDFESANPTPAGDEADPSSEALRLAFEAAESGFAAPAPDPGEGGSHAIDPGGPMAPRALGMPGEGDAGGERGNSGSENEASELRRVVRALAHEIRNPLVSIRTFSELLPDRYEDPEFRDQFREWIGRDVARIDGAVSRLQSLVEQQQVEPVPVDLAHLLDKLLAEHSDDIRTRRLLVLKELDYGQPHAFGDPMLLRDAFGGLLDRAFEQIPERGDLYIASKHHDDEPSLRVLIRYACDEADREAAPEDLESLLAQTLVQTLGGSFTSDTTAADERVIVIDLLAPQPE